MTPGKPYTNRVARVATATAPAPRRRSRSCRRILALTAGLLLAGCGGDRASAQDLLQEGNYEEAIERLEGEYSQAPTSERAEEIARLLQLTGQLDEAESFLRGALAQSPGEAALQLRLGRVLLEGGRRDEAEEILEVAATGTSGAALLARVHLGEILLDRGNREEALALFDTFIDIYNGAAELDSRQILAVATAVRNLGVLNSALYADALRAYDEAIAADPENLEAHLGVATLFLERYNLTDARQAFREVLTRESLHPPALLGLARAAEIEGSPEGAEALEAAISVNPNFVPALVLRARAQFAGEEVNGAMEDLDHALEVNPNSSEALGVLAGIRYLQGNDDAFDDAVERALAINPRNAGFFVAVALLLSDGRLYAEAAEFAGRGVALDSLAWEAFGAQGLNQLRVGEMAAGRQNLEIAFEGDPFNIWYKNTLDLLDVIDEFEEFSTPRFRIFVDPEDGEALAIYMTELAERAYGDLSTRYGFTPATPIRIEAFRRSGDFSVRTMGLTGLGALGVSFGPVVALDSPSARSGTDFNWASTLWHEIVHTFHLGLTDHHVPRWLSEGLAVHEERRAATGWGMRPPLAFFMAYIEEEVRAPSELSLSFVRPRTPAEVGVAYVQGSLIMEWIEEEWGFDAILGMLEGYRDLLPPAAVAERELGLNLGQFDARFNRWLRDRYEGAFAAAEAAMELREMDPPPQLSRGWLEERIREVPIDLESRMALARLLIEENDLAAAIPHLEEALEIYPENPVREGPNRLLAHIHEERGNRRAAIAALRDYLTYVAEDGAAHLELARLLEEEGDLAGAAQAMENAMYVYPFDLASHEKLADLFRQTRDFEGEIRERKVFLALDPPDRAGALFRLAEAQFAAGRREDARASVLGALEVAPRFAEAQDLLLRILGGP